MSRDFPSVTQNLAFALPSRSQVPTPWYVGVQYLHDEHFFSFILVWPSFRRTEDNASAPTRARFHMALSSGGPCPCHRRTGELEGALLPASARLRRQNASVPLSRPGHAELQSQCVCSPCSRLLSCSTWNTSTLLVAAACSGSSRIRRERTSAAHSRLSSYRCCSCRGWPSKSVLSGSQGCSC